MRTPIDNGSNGWHPAPETELVLLSAATQVGDERAAKIDALLRGRLEWDAVAEAAHRHGVMPLLYRHLSARAAGLVPRTVMERLRHDYLSNSLRNRYLSGELVRLAALFESRGINAVAYKGPTLAQTAYGDLALRQFVDLDLIVVERDFSTAAAILRREGYLQWFDCKTLELGFFQAHKDVFAHRDGIRQVDLHWRLTPRYFPFGPDPDLLWRRARRVALEGGSVLTLAPQDLMLALCGHASRHGWNCLTLVCDIAELVRSNPDVDWCETLEEARRLGNRRMVTLGFQLAHELAGAELPDRLMQAVRSDSSVLALGRSITRRLLAELPSVDDSFQPWVVPLMTIERARDRLRYCVDRALAPTVNDARFVTLPKPLLPLHYLLRPLRLVLTQARRLKDRPLDEMRRSIEPAR